MRVRTRGRRMRAIAAPWRPPPAGRTRAKPSPLYSSGGGPPAACARARTRPRSPSGGLRAPRCSPVCYSEIVITGVQVSETLQLVFVLVVLTCTIGGIYLMQRYTGV